MFTLISINHGHLKTFEYLLIISLEIIHCDSVGYIYTYEIKF